MAKARTVKVIHANMPMTKAKLWSQGYARDDIEAAADELEDKDLIGRCLIHEDCVVVDGGGS